MKRPPRKPLPITRLGLWIAIYFGLALGEWLGFLSESITAPITMTAVLATLCAAWLIRAWVDKRIAEIDAATDDDLTR